VYRAVVTLTAKTGFTFTGVAAGSFTYSGATSVANAANSGTVTITFPATAAPSADTVVTALSLNGLVTAPVTGETPNTTSIDVTQYTGNIVWQTESGAIHTGAFAASTVYKAVVTLIVKTGFTFTGVAAGSFTYTGATTIANAVNSGTVTITFPATGVPGTDLDLQVSFIDPDTNREVYFSAVTGNQVITSKGNVSGVTSVTITAGYSDFNNYTYRWLVDGVEVEEQTTRSFSPRAVNYDVGNHWVTVIATRTQTGVSYSRDLFIVVVD
jgi:hypothetical protein